jgi:hypothetical protein
MHPFGRGSLIEQRVWAHQPGGDGIGTVGRSREDRQDPRDLWIGAAILSELESRIESALPGSVEGEQNALGTELTNF